MKHNGPPKLFHTFFRWYCNPAFMQNIEGDLLERYNERVQLLGTKTANRKFKIDVLKLFRPSIIRPIKFNHQVHSIAMYRNYFITAWRNLVKNTAFSAINIVGL